MKTYSEKLKDPRWQKKRLEVMQRDDFQCTQCGDAGSTLAVHHLYYVSGRHPWQYPAWSLQTLCKDCHQNEHDTAQEHINGEDPTDEWESLLGFLGVRSPSDFGRLWDAGVECAMLRKGLGGDVIGPELFFDRLAKIVREHRNRVGNDHKKEI